MLLLLAFTQLLFLQTSSKCSLGCLACKKPTEIEFECEVCDLFNKYAMNDSNQCQMTDIPDCLLNSADHRVSLCLRCRDGFVIDPEQKKCVEIPSYALVDNCKSYLTMNHCDQCNSGHYINQGQCSSVSSAVEGCMTYTDGSACSQCESGKYLKGLVCEDITLVDNCSIYTEIVCDSCASNHFLEKNYFSVTTMSTSIAHTVLMNYFNSNETVQAPLSKICYAQNIDNCATYRNFTECSSCNSGYFLNANRMCTLNPSNPILNCEEYESKKSCSKCSDSYFLRANECVSRTMVANCTKYENSSSNCVSCSNTHYLASNECKERLFSKYIEYCTTLNPYMDNCSACKNRFRLTADNLSCLFEIAHCISYTSQTTYNTPRLLCAICDHGYFRELDFTKCIAQDVSHCKDYVDDSKNCETCDPGYYYNGAKNACNAYTVKNCTTLNQTSDECSECNIGYYLKTTECHPYTIINCRTLETDKDECKECEENHFLLNTDKNCYMYNLIGCVKPKVNTNQCDQCLPGYYLDSNDEHCYKNNLPNCKITSSTENKCEKCNDGYYLFEFSCHKSNVPFCTKFTENTNTCISCKTGYYIKDEQCVKKYRSNCLKYSSNNNNCESCETGYYLISNACEPQNRSHCITYTINTNNCSECEANYYKLNNGCIPQVLPGCLIFLNKSSLTCTNCDQGYYLKNDKCLPYTIINCSYPEASEDECKVCETDFILDNNTKNCIISNNSHCKTVTAGVCTECQVGYILDSTHCFLANHIPNCILPSDTSEKCKICASGYYEESGVCIVFLENTIPNCLEYEINVKECLRCINLMYPDSSTSCAAITEKSKCRKSNGTVNECIECKAGFPVDGSTTTKCGNISTDLIDIKCYTSDNDILCNSCEKGYSLLNKESETVELNLATSPNFFRIIDNCVDFINNDTVGEFVKCKQCKEGYTLSTNACIKHSDLSTIICAQKEADKITTLDNATECTKCWNYKKHYLTADTCTERGKFITNCYEYEEGTDSYTNCLKCEENTTRVIVKNYSVCAKTAIGNGTVLHTKTNISNCLVYNYEYDGPSTTCHLCKPGYYNSSTSCPEYTKANDSIYIANALTAEYIFKTLKVDLTADNVTTNGQYPVQLTKDSLTYANCNDQYIYSVGIIEVTAATKGFQINQGAATAFHNIDPFSGEPHPTYEFKQIKDCIQKDSINTFFKTDVNSVESVLYTKNSFNYCASVGVVPTAHYICMKCDPDTDPYLIRINKKSDSSPISTTKYFINLECNSKTTQFKKKYKGGITSTALINVFDLLHVDSCTDMTKTLVAKIQIETAEGAYWSVPTTTKTRAIECVSILQPEVKVEGCQFYLVDAQTISTITIDKTKMYCGSCKPGYKQNITDNKITACALINGCDLSDDTKNTWMNLCETCKDTHSRKFDTNIKIDFSKCDLNPKNASNFVENCELYNNDQSGCVFCKDGYALTSSKSCMAVDSTENGCASMGREPNDFSNNISDSPASDLTGKTPEDVFENILPFMQIKYNSRFVENNFGCNSCSDTTLEPLVITTSYTQTQTDPIGACLAGFIYNYDKASHTQVKNCKHVTGQISSPTTKCAECNEGYSLKEGSCTLWTKTTYNVLKLDSGDQITKCKAGTVIDIANNECSPTNNCLKFDTYPKCKICKVGYIYDDITKICVKIPDSHPCMNFVEKNCVRCKNGGIPITFETNNDGNTTEDDRQLPPKVICSPSNLPIANMYTQQAFVYSESGFKREGYSLADKIGYKEIGLFPVDTGVATKFATTVPKQVCIPSPKYPGCVKMGPGIKCLECASGWMLASPYECVKGIIENCDKYDTEMAICISCLKGYVLESQKCKNRVAIDNCEIFVPNKDNCEKCIRGFVINSTFKCELAAIPGCDIYSPTSELCEKCFSDFKLDNNHCVSISSPNCMYSMSDSICRLCEPGYYLDKNNHNCVKYTFTGCNIYNKSQDSCIQCEANYYSKNTTGTCIRRTAKNCLVGAYDADNCLSCPNGFYFDKDELCRPYIVSECSLYDPHNNKCLDCNPGLFLNEFDNCVTNPDITCAIPGKYLNGCVECQTGYYYNNSEKKCEAHTVICLTYNQYANTCVTCGEGKYLGSNSLCHIYTVNYCDLYNKFKNRCLNCIEGYYMNFKGECKLISIQNCIVPRLYEDRCIECASGYYKENSTNYCKIYTIDNCQIMDPNYNKCFKCHKGFFINTNGSCEPYDSAKYCLGYNPTIDRCDSCIPGYYYQDFICKAYTQKYCKVKNSFSDSCHSCMENAYLSGGDCLLYTIKDCATYTPYFDKCATCDDDKYLCHGKCKSYTLGSECLRNDPDDDMCLECNHSSHYLNVMGKCIPGSVENCMTYKNNKPDCFKCNSGYFIEDKKCKINPSGIYKCAAYIDETYCNYCMAPYYLYDNKCQLSSVVIANCKIYSHDNSCNICEPNTFLIANECHVANTTLNCATYLDKDNCNSCVAGYALNTAGTNISCIDSEISECESAIFKPDDSTYECVKCKPEHFLADEKTCSSTSNVTDCLYYESETLCSKCKPTKILSKNKLTCSNITTEAGTDCSTGRILDAPVCSICKDGYYFDAAGACTKCNVTGCAVCNVYNLRKCKLCKTGYQMTELFYCETIETIQNGASTLAGNTDGTLTRPESVTINSVLSMLLFILIVNLFTE